MFHRISCFCLPHPGLAIEKSTWSGAYKDIDKDFLRMIDAYAREVFTVGLDTKSILGSDLTTVTFPLVLRDFVQAFHNAAPVAMTFTQAMTSCTVLLAKEQAMQLYTAKMDEITGRRPRGFDPEEFTRLDKRVQEEVKDEYQRITIFGSEDTRSETWTQIEQNLATLHAQYVKDNDDRLQKALVGFANLAILGMLLFGLDRMSDWICDWWSHTCHELSKVMLVAYAGIFIYIGVFVYLEVHQHGRLAAGLAGAELWKEMVRLMSVYAELVQSMNLSEAPMVLKQVFTGHLQDAMKELRKHQKDNKAEPSNKKTD